MIKKLLFISCIFFSTIGFSQEKTIKKLYAAPNPFRNATKIIFNATNTETVIFSVKNILGKTIFHQNFKTKKGKNSIPFSKGSLVSGMYIYTIQDSRNVISKRLVIK